MVIHWNDCEIEFDARSVLPHTLQIVALLDALPPCLAHLLGDLCSGLVGQQCSLNRSFLVHREVDTLRVEGNLGLKARRV